MTYIVVDDINLSVAQQIIMVLDFVSQLVNTRPLVQNNFRLDGLVENQEIAWDEKGQIQFQAKVVLGTC